MSELIKKYVGRFLSHPLPEVMLIKGRSGTGRTFIWNQLLNDFKKNNTLAFSHYSYVSLLGIRSLDELKLHIFEKMLPISEIGHTPTIQSFSKNVAALHSNFQFAMHKEMRDGPSISKHFPIDVIAPSFIELASCSIRNALICLDDITFRGQSLTVEDLAIFAAQLKLNHACKIVVITDDQPLQDDHFFYLHEKLIDTKVTLQRSVEECVDIAIDDSTDTLRLIKACCITLEMSNIKLIRHIAQHVNEIVALLMPFKKELIAQAIRSMVLFHWSVNCQAEGAPSIEYILNHEVRYQAMQNAKEEQDNQSYKKWVEIVVQYLSFHLFDDLDIVLAQAIQVGCYQEQDIITKAKEKNKYLQNGIDINDTMKKLKSSFYSSFANNQNEIAEQIFDALKDNIETINQESFDRCIAVLTQLDELHKVKLLRSLYLQNRPPIAVTVETVLTPHQQAVHILHQINSHHTYSRSEEHFLSTLSHEMCFEILKSEQEQSLKSILDACHFLIEREASSTHISQFVSQMTMALHTVAAESPLNAFRVRGFGFLL